MRPKTDISNLSPQYKTLPEPLESSEGGERGSMGRSTMGVTMTKARGPVQPKPRHNRTNAVSLQERSHQSTILILRL